MSSPIKARQARSCDSPCVIRRTGGALRSLKKKLIEFDRVIRTWHRSNETSRRLDEIHGVGSALAIALVACVADQKVFGQGGASRPGLGSFPGFAIQIEMPA
jgi:transposase